MTCLVMAWTYIFHSCNRGCLLALDYSSLLPYEHALNMSCALMCGASAAGGERVEWRANIEGGSGSARSLGGSGGLSLILSVSDALTWLVDLAAVPSKRTVSLLAEACPCPPEAAALRQLATEEGYKEKVRLLGTIVLDYNVIALNLMRKGALTWCYAGHDASLVVQRGLEQQAAGHRGGVQGEGELFSRSFGRACV